ncbi:GerMN domain-containing protein [Janibacter sp. DB-40]|uniref:GerMN domain-containing protein n=1 Tax=Janibacter sp. DB-40 TaxID=3028808 RepID=UPI002404B942|nr:GerMN domain-containing protein [Janibacter sp. DB-40]
MTGRELTRRSALGLAVAGALAGCGLNTDSTIRPGLPIDGPRPQPLSRTPNGPTPGASPAEVIRGFLRAGSTSGEGLEVTRSYLTQEAAQGWIPDSQTVIYTGDPEIEPMGDGAFRVSARVVARINADGRYLVSPPFDGAAFDFHVDLVDGEWRIDELQEGFGRLLEQPEVGYIFREYPVHYPAIGWNALVVDQRWVTQDQLATRLTRAQLGSIPGYLREAVSSDIGARLAVDAVPVRNGVAIVDLESESVADDATARKRLAAQLVATLMSLPGVTEVGITLSGAPLDLGVTAPLTSPEQLGFVDRTQTNTPIVLARRGDKVVAVDDRLASVGATDLRRKESPFPPLEKGWRHLALRTDGKELAALDGTQETLHRMLDDGEVVHLDRFAAAMTRPCYDYGGVLWVGGSGLGREEGYRLWAINSTVDPANQAESAPQHVPAQWLGTRFVRAAVVSPEGSRIAVISEQERGTGSTLEVSGIARQANGLPTTTSPQAFRIGADLVEMLDAVWVGQSTLAVIGRRNDQEEMQPYLVEVGGPVEAMTPRPGGVAVTTTGDDQDVVVRTGEDRVFQRAGGRWQELQPIDGVVTAGV